MYMQLTMKLISLLALIYHLLSSPLLLHNFLGNTSLSMGLLVKKEKQKEKQKEKERGGGGGG
jgi:hypothetical protein